MFVVLFPKKNRPGARTPAAEARAANPEKMDSFTLSNTAGEKLSGISRFRRGHYSSPWVPIRRFGSGHAAR
jgi:hypothetical protein